MFIGHYGAALAAKRWAPRLSLGWLFVAVQLVDVLFSLLVLIGIEEIRIVPGFTASNAYELVWMPYTHSLVGALGWSLVAGMGARWALGREGLAAAVAIAVCVFSHWVLDLLVHTPDLPLAAGDGPKVGLGLWAYRDLTIAAELVAFGIGAAMWIQVTGGLRRARAATIGFIVALAGLAAVMPFLPPPSGPRDFAVQALAAYAALAAAAAWIDRRRRAAG
jgi:hypothetical protein